MMTKNDKERFNKRISGEVQISADIRVSDLMTEGAAYVTITESPCMSESVSMPCNMVKIYRGCLRMKNMNICPVLFVMWLHSEVILKAKSF